MLHIILIQTLNCGPFHAGLPIDFEQDMGLFMKIKMSYCVSPNISKDTDPKKEMVDNNRGS